MEIAKLTLEYLKAILSPQSIAGAIGLIFLFIFKADIQALMRRIAKIRFPGGGEVSTSQIEKAQEGLAAKEEPPKPVGESTLPTNIDLKPELQQRIRELLDAERARATLWEYRYLNYYLVRTTQAALDWLVGLQKPTTVELADSYWQPLIPSVDERRAILEALRSHHLVDLQDGLIVVTPKGREYVQWRGPLPKPAT